MDLLLVSATSFEIEPSVTYMTREFHKRSEVEFQKSNLNVKVLICGVGMPNTCFALGNLFAKLNFDFVVNVGVAGSFKDKFKIGDVVNVVSEQFGDLGAENEDGAFLSLVDMKLNEANQFPYKDGILVNNDVSGAAFLPLAKGLSVNKTHGYEPHIQKIKKRFPDAEIESMEGAGFFLSCLLTNMPFLSIRGISNRVTRRNKEDWDLPLAIKNVNDVFIQILNTIVKQ